MPRTRRSKQTCSCGCDAQLSREEVRRHLQGKSLSKESLVARARNVARKMIKRKVSKKVADKSSSGQHDMAIDDVPPTATNPPANHLSCEDVDMDAMEEGSSTEDAPPPASVPFPSSEPEPARVEGHTHRASVDGPAAGIGDRAGVWRTRCETIGSTSSHGSTVDGESVDSSFGFWGEVSDEEEEDAFRNATTDVPPWQRGLSATDMLREDFEAERAERGHHMSPDDMTNIRGFNYKVDADLSATSYDKLRRAFPSLNDLLTHQRLQTRMAYLSGLQPVRYHCCVNSCVCFTGPYSSLTHCPFCNENRYNAKNGPRNTFDYLPIVPRLADMFLDEDLSSRMQYRHDYESRPGRTGDFFDSQLYDELRKRHVTVEGEELPHRYFELETDIALGISTDGFCPFKRRKQTCWPIIAFNYNLPPTIRFRLENIICLGVVPGPKKPKDFDSYLVPLVEELYQLKRGSTAAYDARRRRLFSLRAYLVLVFGDMPAISMLMRMKGHNGISPCRACRIRGVRTDGSKTHYAPLHRKHDQSYDPLHLPLRTHDTMMRHALQVADPDISGAESNRRAKRYGITGVPLLSTVSSLSFPASFPHDFMHLIENIVPSLVAMWTGSYKDIVGGCTDYVIVGTVWEAIGDACTNSGSTTPSVFGARVPNIHTQRYQFTAENWIVWSTLLGPVLLRGRFRRPVYYDHFVQLVELINACMQLELSDEEIDKIEAGMAAWVQRYEKLYYQYKKDRLAVCTLPIHALLHVAQDIRHAGPVWCYWAFPMERFCGALGRSIKNPKHPYVSLAHRVRDVAQLNQLKLVYGLARELDLTDDHEMDVTGQRFEEYPDIALVKPSRELPISESLRGSIASHLATVYDSTAAQMRKFVPRSLRHWARFKIIDGDSVNASELVPATAETRDATFIRYTLDVDIHRRNRARAPQFERRAFYGRALRFFELQLPAHFPHHDKQTTLVLAQISCCDISEEGGVLYYNHNAAQPTEIIDVGQIDCLVARIQDSRRWAIAERPAAAEKVDFASELRDLAPGTR